METEKRQRGRPRKKDGAIPFWRFARAGMAICAYDEARGRGDKHSVAVRYAVHFVKGLSPEMPISETEVKRILWAWRPKGSNTILRFERSSLSEEDIHRHRGIREYVGGLQGKKGLILPELPKYDLPRNVASFTIRFAERPSYPRHNRKSPKE